MKSEQTIERVRQENKTVLNFIKEWQSKNEYNPKFLDEYNAKFNAEFRDFLQSNDFHPETIKTFN